MRRPPGASRRFGQSGRNRVVEDDATSVVLNKDKRFQRLDTPTKRRLLQLLDADKGSWTHRTFDLVMTPASVEAITLESVEAHVKDITVIEVKSTRKAIRDESLSGFFFGATETEYMLAALLGDRLRYAFVVLNDNNVYGRPFFVLIPHTEVERRTRAKRTQFQVNFKSGMTPNGTEEVFTSVPYLIAAEAEEELINEQPPTPS